MSVIQFHMHDVYSQLHQSRDFNLGGRIVCRKLVEETLHTNYSIVGTYFLAITIKQMHVIVSNPRPSSMWQLKKQYVRGWRC